VKALAEALGNSWDGVSRWVRGGVDPPSKDLQFAGKPEELDPSLAAGLGQRRTTPSIRPIAYLTASLASAQSFAAQSGASVRGISDPTQFAQALVNAGFNPGMPPLGSQICVRDAAATINATAGRMECP